MVFTASQVGAQHKRNSVENKPASLLVVSLGKTLNGMPPSLYNGQVVGPSGLPIVVASKKRKCKARNLRCLSKNGRSCPYVKK